MCAVLGALFTSVSAQWVKQKVDTTASFRGLSVVNEKVVWASGTGGTVIRTIDGGKTWNVMTVPEAEKLDFRDIEAFDANTAYILSIGNGNRTGRNFRARTFQAGHAQLLGQTSQKRKTGHEPNAGYCVFGRGMQRDDRVGSQGRVIRDAVEIEREFLVIANRNLNSSFLSGHTNASRIVHALVCPDLTPTPAARSAAPQARLPASTLLRGHCLAAS